MFLGTSGLPQWQHLGSCGDPVAPHLQVCRFAGNIEDRRGTDSRASCPVVVLDPMVDVDSPYSQQ